MHCDTGATTAVCVIMWIKIYAGLGLKHTENLYRDSTSIVSTEYSIRVHKITIE